MRLGDARTPEQKKLWQETQLQAALSTRYLTQDILAAALLMTRADELEDAARVSQQSSLFLYEHFERKRTNTLAAIPGKLLNFLKTL